MPQTISEELQAAIQLATDRGFAVFPLWPNSKSPATPNGCTEATSDPEKIRELWQGRKGFNLGVEAKRSGLVLIDVDTKKGRDGFTALAALTKRHGKLPKTLRVLTTTGGLHIYFRKPDGVELHNLIDDPMLGDGLEMRCDNQYLVAPPSVLDGKAYEWLDPNAQIARCPQWLIDLNHAAAKEAERPSPIKSGWEKVDALVSKRFKYTAREAIDRFNQQNGIAGILGRYGYTEAGDDWMHHPNGSGSSGSVHIIRDRSYHFGAGDPLRGKGVGKDGCCFFPFNVFVEMEHRGDAKAAIKAVAAELGMNGTAEQLPPQEDFSALPQFVRRDELKNVEWLWKGRIPLKKLTMISGEQGHGKSTMMADFIARLASGKAMPDGVTVEPCKVLILSCEDDPEDTAGPKLEAMGADLSRILKWPRPFTMDQLPLLEKHLLRDPEIKMVMIEPIYEQVKGDTNGITNVTVPLGQLQDLAARCGVAVVGIHHFGKGKADNANQKTLGSIGFTSKARVNWGVMLKKDDPTIRVFAPGKRNLKLSQALQFRIEDAVILGTNGEEIETCRVVWLDGQLDTDLDTLLQQGSGQVTPADAQKWLTEYLSQGESESNQIMTEGADAGFSRNQLWRAKEKLEVLAVKRGLGNGSKWIWKLPHSEPETQAPEDGPPF